MAHDERRLEVLRAIVQDYVSTNDPVGSKALAERHDLGVSPATIRNDMAVLEEQGYITQPHTSAGRVPTDKGYRLFVDRLSAVKPLSMAERRAIERFLDGAVDLHDVLTRSVRLLAQLTRQVAVVQYPTLSRSAVRHLEVVQVAATRVMVVLITDTGRVEQRVVDCRVDVDAEAVAELRTLLNSAFNGVKLIDAGDKVPGAAGHRARAPAGAGGRGQRDTPGDPGGARRGPAGHRGHGQPRPRERPRLPGHRAAAPGGPGRTGRRPAVDGSGGPEHSAGPDR